MSAPNGPGDRPARWSERSGSHSPLSVGLDSASLSAMPPANAAVMIERSRKDSAVAALLQLPEVQTARILTNCSADVAEEIISGIAAGVNPERAAKVLIEMRPSRAAELLRLMSAGSATDILNVIAGPDRQMLARLRAPSSSTVIMQGQKRSMRHLPRVSQRLMGLAVLIAGEGRSLSLRVEWRGHLLGETGQGFDRRKQVRTAMGFVLAAISYRSQDAADLAYRPVDAMLSSRELSNLAVLLATLSISVLFLCEGGIYGLASNLGSAAVVWGAAYGLVRVGRLWRGVQPPEHKPRRRSGE